MTICAACGTQLGAQAKFCSECGAAVTVSAKPAEYKQVTVLFADVVRSMDIAAAVGPERLRDIMAELFDGSSAVVKRYGGTLSQFTGDGIMAVFGAPITLEDHAFRACLAALDIQAEASRLAVVIDEREHVKLELRVGLNSGQVVAGEISSATPSYTTIGEQVGMAQRMESIAPPGGVMVSQSTARLVEDTVVLGEPELSHIKGSDTPVRARRLLAPLERQQPHRGESPLVGRTWELNTIAAIIDEAVGGAGCVMTIAGPSGIGKSRLIRETAGIANSRGVPVFITHCESHASEVPFHALARLLRAGMGIAELDAAEARTLVHEQFSDAGGDDLLLLDDLLGIRDTSVSLPDIAPEARRRRLTTLINSRALARREPAIYVVEDAQCIDEVSESMLLDFLAVIPQTSSLSLITYRPEYRGALAKVTGGQSITLRPLSGAHVASLIGELVGDDPSVDGLAEQIAERAAGNPFFAEEMVRDLVERGVLQGSRGSYVLRRDVADVDVPATLQATIGARIDRLEPIAKATLNAASVIGSRFDADLLASVVDSDDVAALIEAELVDQVTYTACPKYAFRHPLIRTVAYESQLRSHRAQVHRSLAAVIEGRDPAAADENAALIAEHLEAAGDNHAAFDWHMRAAAWLNIRDITAAHASLGRAQRVADRLPENDPERMAMRIAPRALQCALAYRVGGSSAKVEFDELRDLCTAVRDQRSLVIGMTGPLMGSVLNARRREASLLADEYVELLESLGDDSLTIGFLATPISAKYETGEITEVLRLAQRVLDLAGGDLTKGTRVGTLVSGSPLALTTAFRSGARACLGIAGWKDDLRKAIETSRAVVGDPNLRTGVMWYTYINAIPLGFVLPDSTALHATAETLEVTEQSGDDFALKGAQMARAITLVHREGAEHEAGIKLLHELRDAALNQQFSLTALPLADGEIAREQALSGDVAGAISLSRTIVNDLRGTGGCIWTAYATTVLVELLLSQGKPADIEEARAAIETLANEPTDDGFVINEIFLLRLQALLARAEGDDAGYQIYRDRYRKMAADLGFEGHMAWAAAMP
jgi:adenylate cyclase